jgi:hypothetical protein
MVLEERIRKGDGVKRRRSMRCGGNKVIRP